MSHPLVDQLRFTRSEFVRGLAEVGDPQAQQRIGSMNSISWMVGHLAWQEQRYWLYRAQGKLLKPEIQENLAYGKPASTPPAAEMWSAWREITAAADPWLDGLTAESIQAPLGEGLSSVGTFLLRMTYHYWYHLGEGLAVRQMLGQTDLPEYVGDIDSQAPYRPDSGGRTPEPARREDFLRKVRDGRTQWDARMAQFDDRQMLQVAGSGSWSLKDILAHLTWHEREMVGLLRGRALAGSELWNLPLEQRNAAIYAQIRDQSLEQARAEAREVWEQLDRQLNTLTEDDLNDPARFAGMPAEWAPWQILADNTYLHYRDHLADIGE
jgi:uncharacterized damage-inducible protein DinB